MKKDKPLNIIIVNHYAGNDNLGMEFRPYYMALGWNKYNVKTTIIAASYSHLRSKQPKSFGWESIKGIKYLWLWTNKYKGNGIKRLLSMIAFVTQIFLITPYLILKLKPKIIIASSTYPFDIFPCFLLARLSRAKLIFEIHDLWPLSLIELGNISTRHPLIKLIRFSEWFAYKFSDKIVSILPNTFVHAAKDGLKKENFLHVPNGVNLIDKSLVNMKLPSHLLKLLNKIKSTNSKLIIYAGSIGVSNDMETLVKAAHILNQKPITFLIIGDGPIKAKLEKFVTNNFMSNVYFEDRIAKNILNIVLHKADFLYVGLQKKSLYQYGISLNKLYDYMLAGKPIISAIDAFNNPILQANCGFNVEPSNPKVLADSINMAITTSIKELKSMGQRGKSYVVREHNYEVLSKKFLHFISN